MIGESIMPSDREAYINDWGVNLYGISSGWIDTNDIYI